MNTQELEHSIRDAFRNTPYPKGKLTDTYDDEGVAEYFSGTTWSEHSVSNLRHHVAALSFFEPDAFRYFLPAFMLAELENREVADVIKESIVFSFGEPEGYWVSMYEKRISLFTKEEKIAIMSFLSYMGQESCFCEYVTYAFNRLRS